MKTKIFLSPFHTAALVAGAERLAQYSITVSVDPHEGVLVDGKAPERLGASIVVLDTPEIRISARRVGRATLCVSLERTESHSMSCAERTAWTIIQRAVPYAPVQSVEQAKPAYESTRAYRERIERKKAKGRYAQERVRLPR